MNDEIKQLMKEQLGVIPKELYDFLFSEEFSRKVQLVSKKYHLDSDQERSLQNILVYVLLIMESVDFLPSGFEDEMSLSPEKSKELAKDIEDYVLPKVRIYLADTEKDLVSDESSEKEPQKEITISPNPDTLKPSVPITLVSTIPTRPEEILTKEHILSQIENPPRTVLKKYVLEQEPITDPEYLIDDTVDERPRLE